MIWASDNLVSLAVMQNHHVKIIFGFTPEDRKEEYGVLMYHRNRLIKAYEKVGYQKQVNICFLSRNSLEPWARV